MARLGQQLLLALCRPLTRRLVLHPARTASSRQGQQQSQSEAQTAAQAVAQYADSSNDNSNGNANGNLNGNANGNLNGNENVNSNELSNAVSNSDTNTVSNDVTNTVTSAVNVSVNVDLGAMELKPLLDASIHADHNDGIAFSMPDSVTQSVMGDGNNALTSLHWSHWGRYSATATGVDVVNDCVPYCAAGHFHGYPVTVRLDRARPWKNHAGRWQYTRLEVVYHGPRPAFSPAREVFPLWS